MVPLDYEMESISVRSHEYFGLLNRLVYQQIYTSAGPVVILFTGLIIRALLPSSLFDKLQSSPIFAESNILNELFANHGFSLFTALYLLISSIRIMTQLTRSQPQSLLPSTTQTRYMSRTRQVGYLLVDILCKYLITLLMLILLMKLRDAVVDKNDELNISGHFIVITTITVSLLAEARVSISNELLEVEDQTNKAVVLFWIMSSVLGLTSLLIVIWWCVLFVTTVFYHTVPEKVIGLIFGYSSPVLVYYIKPLVVQCLYT